MQRTDIRKAIESLGEAIAADSSRARGKNVPATARLVEALRCEVSGPHGGFFTDMAPAMGGGATAPNPGWFLRGALASCAATVIAMRAAKLGIRLEMLEVTVESDSDLRGILGLDESIPAGHVVVRTKVKIRGDAQPETLREIVEWADEHSPVGCTVKDGAACSLEVHVSQGPEVP